MTRPLLLLIAEGRERGLLRGLVVFLVVVAIGPAIAVDVATFVRDRCRARRVMQLRTVACDAGHPVPLIGAWICPTCHAPFEGHGFGRCPHCGARAYLLTCACSRGVVNPLADLRS